MLKKNYGPKCDIWSTGVIAFILLSGTPPFQGKTDDDIMKAVLKGEFKFEGDVWKKVSDTGKDFINKLLTYD